MIKLKNNSFFNILISLLVLTGMLASQRAFSQLPDMPQQQVEYSDSELLAFVNAANKVLPIQQESQMKMIGEIEEENLTIDQFNDMMKSFSNGEDINAPAEEIESFNNALEGIQNIQIEYNEIIVETITTEGIEPAKFEEIMTNYQQDPQLQSRVNEILEKLDE
jgi:hypothetical protein